VVALCATFAVSLGASTASADSGNSENAKACQKGGWEDLRRSDGTSFKNAGECVAYAARGGALEPDFAGRAVCEALGFTFSLGTGNTIWRCGPSSSSSDIGAFIFPCTVDGGFAVSWNFFVVDNHYHCLSSS
jgi:hypothetical protein